MEEEPEGGQDQPTLSVTEVDPRLARRKVELRCDPFDLSTVQVWCDGRRFDDARPYDLVCQHDRRVRPQDQDAMTLPKTGLSYLDT